jgi:hypothetical protein
VLVDALPKRSNGKVDRTAVHVLARDTLAARRQATRGSAP